MNLRIGQGFDVHTFGPGDHVTLGGVRIPHLRGLLAHSDGDVLVHAICDALLGALALGDIGQHFPPDDPRWEGADSLQLLRQVLSMLAQRGYTVINIDSTVICERPRLRLHVAAMQQVLAGVLEVTVDAVSIKATTTEKLGFTGRGEGIAAQAVVLLGKVAGSAT